MKRVGGESTAQHLLICRKLILFNYRHKDYKTVTNGIIFRRATHFQVRVARRLIENSSEITICHHSTALASSRVFLSLNSEVEKVIKLIQPSKTSKG